MKLSGLLLQLLEFLSYGLIVAFQDHYVQINFSPLFPEFCHVLG